MNRLYVNIEWSVRNEERQSIVLLDITFVLHADGSRELLFQLINSVKVEIIVVPATTIGTFAILRLLNWIFLLLFHVLFFSAHVNNFLCIFCILNLDWPLRLPFTYLATMLALLWLELVSFLAPVAHLMITLCPELHLGFLRAVEAMVF